MVTPIAMWCCQPCASLSGIYIAAAAAATATAAATTDDVVTPVYYYTRGGPMRYRVIVLCTSFLCKQQTVAVIDVRSKFTIRGLRWCSLAMLAKRASNLP